MYLVDTNVLSELRKGTQGNPGVRQFYALTARREMYIAVQTIGEIRRGIENLRQKRRHRQAAQLEFWLKFTMMEYADRQLSFDTDCAQVWGLLMAPQPHHPIDKQIAAIALVYDLTVVTRNVSDFLSTGVRLENPFT
ncbi:type II toxin-antitoxin system VapC family toxin [Duganella radicis]|uniref:PIN domain-containing protein n=1 Tax=Duganella radicis TaxID=551988 RepID=A0A6L6PIA0_9BURK|nr:type II toxin-antitoxin system VapC family toxin [Duganella radicis]MTV38702.1 PIN domain-containing protein [Duganella radicis]